MRACMCRRSESFPKIPWMQVPYCRCYAANYTRKRSVSRRVEWPFLFPLLFSRSLGGLTGRSFFFIESQRMSAEINSNWREIRYIVLLRIAHLLRRESVDVEIPSPLIATRRNTRREMVSGPPHHQHQPAHFCY